MHIPRNQTMTALFLLMAGMSAIQATGALTGFVSADGTLTIQLTRTTANTEPPSASGTVQIILSTGQFMVQLDNAIPSTAYTATFLTVSTSSILQLGYVPTGSDGAGSLQANLSSGTFEGIFQLTRLGLVQYASVTTTFTVGTSAPNTDQVQGQDTTQTNNTASLQVQPPSATITAGGFAKFEVNVVASSSADVSLVARGMPSDTVAIFTPNVGVANPDFNSSLTIVTSSDTPQGSYLVTAVAIVNGTEYTNELSLQILPSASITVSSNSTSTSTAMNATLGTTLSVTINTDQSQYQPNSTVNVQGQVTDAIGNAVADATVALQVDTPTGGELFYTNNIHTDSAGTFQTQVALGSGTPTGTYTVFASASKPGYSSTTTRVTFVVGTSTTPSVIIQAVYAGDSAGNPTSTFTSAQTIWIWVVIENIGATFQGIVWIQVRDPNGVPVQIQTHVAQLQAGQTIKDGLEFSLPGDAPIGVYTVNALVSDKLISQGGTFLASSGTQFALTG